MNGTKPKFVRDTQRGYYEKPNHYVNAPSCHVNLLELSRYANKGNISIKMLNIFI